MVCIHCGGLTQVINSRPQQRLNQVWRRRRCLACGTLFTSHEAAAYDAAWAVLGPNDHIHPFSRDKLFLSLHRSLQHRPDAVNDATALTETVIKKLHGSFKEGAVASQTILNTVQVALNRFDTAASTHYQAFHPSA